MSGGDRFSATLDETLPGWQERRAYPFVFAALACAEGRAGSPAAAAVEQALGPVLDRTVSIPDALIQPLGDVSEAAAAVERLFTRTLAYDLPWLEEAAARRLADAFIQCFAAGGVFWTNGDLLLSGGSARTWNPLTTASFDTGIVGVAGDLSGVVWVTDED